MVKKRDVCGEVWNILGVQYKPRDKILRKSFMGESLKKYKRMNKCKKIQVIDKLQAGGYFS